MVLQAAILDCSSFDPFSLQQNGLSSAEVDVGRGEIAQAFVIAAMIVVIDEGVDPGFQVAGQIIVFKQDPVLERLMPALDLVLRLRVAGCAVRTRSTRLAGSVRDRAIAISFVTSSSPMVNSTTTAVLP